MSSIIFKKVKKSVDKTARAMMNNYPQNQDEAVYTFEVEGVMIGREHDAQDMDGSLCWCQPCVKRFADGDLVIHRDFGGTEH